MSDERRRRHLRAEQARRARREAAGLPESSPMAQYIADEQMAMLDGGGGVLDMGRTVVCDAACAQDFTDSPAVGGILFRTWAVCPDCAPRFEASDEADQIRERARPGETFGDFVRRYRREHYGDERLMVVVEAAPQGLSEMVKQGPTKVTYQNWDGEAEGMTFLEPLEPPGD